MPGFADRASILQGAGDMIFKLVLEGSTPEQWAAWLRVPLEHAAGTANADMVQKLIKAGADGSAGWKGCHGRTLLHAAAEGGDGQVITALIRAGAGADKNVKAPDTIGRTPLHVAIASGKEDAAGVLIMAGANVNILDANKVAPLHLAVSGGHSRVAKDLLLSGANHDVRGGGDSYPIHLAARRGHDEAVLSLIQRGANLDRVDKQEKTPLAVAVLEDRVSTAKVLLDGGADANFKSGVFDDTALHVAAELNRAAFIPPLVDAWANIESKDSYNETPLLVATCYDSRAAMLALLRLGAHVNTKNESGWTPLHGACHNGLADAADLLLRWGADEAIADKDGKTPSQKIPDIAQGYDQRRTMLERLTKLLANAPQDRAWRRRGFVVMCRAHPNRLRLAVEISDDAVDATRQQPRERPSRRARRGQVTVEVQVGSASGTGVSSGENVGAGRSDGGEGAGGGGFDEVAAWVVVATDEDVFRKIVGFL